MRVRTIHESEGLLERILDGRNFSRVKKGNLGHDAFLLVQNEVEIPDGKLVHLSIGASAGDDGTAKEDLSNFEKECREFGAYLGKKTGELRKEKGWEFVVQTGGCMNIADWVTTSLKEADPRVIALALYPKIGERGNKDPRNGPEKLKQYDFVLATDMDIQLRSIMVGTVDILYIIHGGSGSGIEFNTAIDQSGMVVFYNIPKSGWGIVKKSMEYLRSNYRNNGAVFFRNSSYKSSIDRSFVEYDARQKNLQGNLSAVVIYKHIHKNPEERSNDCLLINFRKCELPVTYYHRGKEHEPLEQILVANLAPEKLIKLFKNYNDINGELEWVKPIERYERPHMFKLRLYHYGRGYNDGNVAKWMKVFREGLERDSPERIFYHRFFDDNPKK